MLVKKFLAVTRSLGFKSRLHKKLGACNFNCFLMHAYTSKIKYILLSVYTYTMNTKSPLVVTCRGAPRRITELPPPCNLFIQGRKKREREINLPSKSPNGYFFKRQSPNGRLLSKTKTHTPKSLSLLLTSHHQQQQAHSPVLLSPLFSLLPDLKNLLLESESPTNFSPHLPYFLNYNKMLHQDLWSINAPTAIRPSKSAPCSPIKPTARPRPSEAFHVTHKVPVGDTPYVRAKRVQVMDQSRPTLVSIHCPS